MSRLLIARSPDLQQLRNEGYDLEVRGGYLLIKDVPYVDSAREIKRGILISTLELHGDQTARPTTHVAMWTGEHPCHHDGCVIAAITNPSPGQNLGNDIRADFTFSAKAAYRDYHHKMTTYIGRITGEARVIDPAVTANTFPVIAAEEDESVFRYLDTATSRVGIGALNERLSCQKIAIVGLGGTGSYVLDLVAKSCAKEIHLFDGDIFSQHNAFRSPGAASIEELQAKPLKVTYLASLYGNMRRGIHAHEVFANGDTAVLREMDFVFLCLDRGTAKKAIINSLVDWGIPFVDVGMGILRAQDSLTGLIRVTCFVPGAESASLGRIDYSDGDLLENEYSTNIQIAELNALNAALAVLQWKKLHRIYRDSSRATSFSYSIAANEMANDEEGAA
ncbi:ThiF family adenylyltransferase [Burkholderia pseudomallei]|uniref:ThiF family adenylyltransferase n=1 Tax=Burkholderia pseudomallei TaxID=28450 RepID=UPI002AB55690|nr:ThiF family adenylyltransferase [Burkholderia pseudomallei]MDY7815198.1 ThiF family adenylyltransferase [Burkholderia pseudomallei]MDY7861759.1 ThiF family adenylyltransferase [Burkholderia pseudomallei]